jgi:hypothetical protein
MQEKNNILKENKNVRKCVYVCVFVVLSHFLISNVVFGIYISHITYIFNVFNIDYRVTDLHVRVIKKNIWFIDKECTINMIEWVICIDTYLVNMWGRVLLGSIIVTL